MSNNLVLILNCGSSSVKFSILNPITNKKYLYGQSFLSFCSELNIEWNINNVKYNKIFKRKQINSDIISYILQKILLKQPQSILSQIIGIGHRVVHGGSILTKSVIINKKVISDIKDVSYLSPLHNPINLMGIQYSMQYFTDLSEKNVAVFDTSFYKKLPQKAYLYAIPYYFYRKHNIRRYGAHGISHSYITNQTSKILNKSEKLLNIISCHLGNGSSIAAIRDGICVDVSMGFTPLEGLVMGTRSGDIDPSVIFFMYTQLKLSIDEIQNILNTKSGLLGLNGISHDCRYATENYFTEESAKRSVDVFCYRLSKYIAGYSILMKEKIDAVVFTGGIGENSSLIRKLVISQLTSIGLNLDNTLNIVNDKRESFFINKIGTIPILVIRTNEDLFIANDVLKILSKY